MAAIWGRLNCCYGPTYLTYYSPALRTFDPSVVVAWLSPSIRWRQDETLNLAAWRFRQRRNECDIARIGMCRELRLN